MGIEFNTILQTDLRDSGGHQLKVLEVVAVEGNYTAGGVILSPSNFGFDEIISFNVQGNIILPADEWNQGDTEAWVQYASITASRTDINLDGNVEWRLIVMIHPFGYGGEPGDPVFELPDGTPMQFIPQSLPTATIIGA